MSDDDWKDLFDNSPKDFFSKINNVLSSAKEFKNKLRILKNKFDRKIGSKTIGIDISEDDYDVEFARFQTLLYEFIDENIDKIEKYEQVAKSSIINYFEELSIQLDEYKIIKELVQESNVRTFLLYHSNRYLFKASKSDYIDTYITWIWNHSLSKYLRKESQVEIKFLKNTGSDWLSDFFVRLFGIMDTGQKRLEKTIDILMGILQTKDVIILIPSAIDTIPKNTNNSNFLQNIWQKIAQEIKNKNTNGTLNLIFIQNGKSLDDCQYTTHKKKSIDSFLPFLIQYNGFIHIDQCCKEEDIIAFKKWLNEDKKRRLDSIISFQRTIYGKDFISFFLEENEDGDEIVKKEKVKEYLYKHCSCGTVEKLFDNICSELGLEFSYDNNNHKWITRKKNQDLEGLENA